MSKLVQVSSCDKADRVGDVIFVHGLGGDPHDTWQSEGQRESFWPAWLGEDLPQVGVWSAGYDASPSSWLGGHMMPLVDRATNLLATLDGHGLGERPIVFIAHSMGGLVCKELLRQAAVNANPRWEQIVGATKGVVFLATPHTGADLARALVKIGTLLRLSKSVKELEENASQLRQLGTWFSNNVGRLGMAVEAYFETVPTHLVGLVVDESSANPGISGVIPISVDATHTEICRLTSRDAMVYLRVKRFVSECLLRPTVAHEASSPVATENREARAPDRDGTAVIRAEARRASASGGVARFNWLHLTDLHFGRKGASYRWPDVRDAFFDDLSQLRERCGPWHAVLFTGDLVFSGQKEEFEGVKRYVLGPLWEYLTGLGSEPILLAVPGNHDLIRPDPHRLPPEVRLLTDWANNPGIHEEFWEQENSPYRQAIQAAFQPYLDWWGECDFRGPVRAGRLPGDFVATVETEEGLRIGIAGLNWTFLQLTAGDYEGRLACDPRQLAHACEEEDVPAWVKQHHACLLLTHQGPKWLSARVRDTAYGEINPAGRFVTHLHGHMHVSTTHDFSDQAGPIMRWWQGRALFGLEFYETREEQHAERLHGYTACRLEYAEGKATMQQWPRKAVKGANPWRFVAAVEEFVLVDEHTKPQEFQPPTEFILPSVAPPSSGGRWWRGQQYVPRLRMTRTGDGGFELTDAAGVQVTLPRELPKIDTTVGEEAVARPRRWKQVHRLTEELYSIYKPFQESMQAFIRSKNSNMPQRANADLNNASDLFAQVEAKIGGFEAELKTAFPEERRPLVIAPLCQLSLCRQFIAQDLAAPWKSGEMQNCQELIEAISDWLLKALHCADLVLEEHFGTDSEPMQ